MKDEDKRPCLEPDSTPRSQRPSDQNLRLIPLGNWDRPKPHITLVNSLRSLSVFVANVDKEIHNALT
jgi:hypothetical protein